MAALRFLNRPIVNYLSKLDAFKACFIQISTVQEQEGIEKCSVCVDQRLYVIITSGIIESVLFFETQAF